MKAHLDDCRVRGEPGQKGGHNSDAGRSEDQPVKGGQRNSLGGRGVRPAAVSGPQSDGDDRVDAHAEADGHGIDEVLNRVHQREGSHGLLADFGYKEAVHDVVQGVDQHGQHHGQGHRGQEGEDGPLLHKCLAHCSSPFRAEGFQPQKSRTAVQWDRCAAKKSRGVRDAETAGKIHTKFL